MATMKGIDISTYQRNIDYNKVKADGINFAILRIGYTGYGAGKNQAKDVQFETHYAGCKKAGIHLGGYFFGRGVSAAEGKKEAEYVLSVIKGKSFDYPIFYDTEDSYYQAKASKAANTAACKAFCDTIKAAGYKTGIYASKYWFQDHLNDNELKGYDHWVAQYNTKCTYTGTYTMWQYSDKGKVNGISGSVDVNYCYVDYVKDNTKVEPPKAEPKKTADEVAAEIVAGKGGWGNGAVRKQKVTEYGLDYNVVQAKVNALIAKQNTKPVVKAKPKKGDAITLKNKPLYANATTKKSSGNKSGTYYIYDGEKINGRYRITNKPKNCGKKPVWLYVTGFVEL